jgi:hypothetical protein
VRRDHFENLGGKPSGPPRHRQFFGRPKANAISH